METLNYNKKCWEQPCPKVDCKSKCCCGLKYVNIPSSLGDDSEGSPVAPENGMYCNSIVVYEANRHVYFYSSEGVPTLIDVDAQSIAGLEQALNDEVRIRVNADNVINERIDDLSDDFIYKFDTVAAMKASTKLKAGDYARTGGFHSVNDGGGALYRISSTGTANEMDVIAVGILFASFIDEHKVVSPEQFGAYGDNVHDDTAAIRTAATYTNSVLSLRPTTYLVSIATNKESVITFVNKDNVTIKGNDAKLQLANNDQPGYELITFTDCKNFNVYDLELIGDRVGHTYTAGSTHEFGYGVQINTNSSSLQTTKNCFGSLHNLKIHDMTGDAIITKNGYATGTIEILDCELYRCRRQGISILDSDTIIVRDTYIHEIGLTQDGVAGTSPTSGIDVEPASGTQALNYLLVEGCRVEDCYRYSVVNGNSNATLIEVKNTKLNRPVQCKSKLVMDNVDLDFADSTSYYGSGTDFGTDANNSFKYSTVTVRGSNKQVFNGHYLHVKGVIINDTWGASNAPKLPSGSKIYDSIFEKMLITTGDTDTTIDPSVLNNNVFISCQFYNSGNPLVFTNCTFIDCTKYSFNTSIQRTFINCYFSAIPDANMQYSGCHLLDGTPITDNI